MAALLLLPGLATGADAPIPLAEYRALPEWTDRLAPFSGRFGGQKVLVTGGSSGIGLASVLGFRKECADVVLVGSNGAKARASFDALSALPAPQSCAQQPRLFWLSGNLANSTVALSVVKEAIELLGGLDVAVNCAGMAGVPGVQIGEPRILELLNSPLDPHSLNVYGMLYAMHAQVAHWVETGSRGAIVNVGSLCGEHPGICGTMYTSSKFATIGFSKQAAVKYAPLGIRVNVLDPGLVHTQMLRDDYGPSLAPDDPVWLASRAPVDAAIPLKSIAEPWEMAGPVLFLADRGRASYVTGAVLTADGALTQVGAFNSEAAALSTGLKQAPAPAEKVEL